MATPTDSNLEALKTQFEGLLDLMLTPAPVSVALAEEDSITVQIESGDDTGLLIGKHGKTIEALGLLANLMYKQKNGEWTRVIVNAADWKEKEERRLKDLAESVAHRAIETGQPQYLYSLSSSQRRTIHMLLSENAEVETLSEGDGEERYLIVQPKAQ